MAPRDKICKEFVKSDESKLTFCGGVIEDSRCPNKAEHMMRYKTGFCENKNCEGTNKKSYSGTPMPTCTWWKICPCDCHRVYDQMFAMSEMPRILVDNSKYSPNHSEYSMPNMEERIALTRSFTPDHTDTPIIVKSPLADAIPTSIARSYAPTSTGHAARGELEAWVKEVCDVWLVENLTAKQPPCTPVYIQHEVGKTQGITEPSIGAVDAVLKRWTNINFAVILLKPTRFSKYTDFGIKYGLDGCKEKFKRAKKMNQSASKRVLR